jgi:hypothetical protein
MDWRHPINVLRSASRRVFSHPSGGPASSTQPPPNPTPEVLLQVQRQQIEASPNPSPSRRRRDLRLSRRERAQQRARELLGSNLPDDLDVDETQQRAKCRPFSSNCMTSPQYPNQASASKTC